MQNLNNYKYHIFANKKFENIGYVREFYLQGKYIGSQKIIDTGLNADETLTKLGYSGRLYHTAQNDISIPNSLGRVKKIKKGVKYYTELLQLCGKLIDK